MQAERGGKLASPGQQIGCTGLTRTRSRTAAFGRRLRRAPQTADGSETKTLPDRPRHAAGSRPLAWMNVQRFDARLAPSCRRYISVQRYMTPKVMSTGTAVGRTASMNDAIVISAISRMRTRRWTTGSLRQRRPNEVRGSVTTMLQKQAPHCSPVPTFARQQVHPTDIRLVLTLQRG